MNIIDISLYACIIDETLPKDGCLVTLTRIVAFTVIHYDNTATDRFIMPQSL